MECTRTAQVQARENPRMKKGSGYQVPDSAVGPCRERGDQFSTVKCHWVSATLLAGFTLRNGVDKYRMIPGFSVVAFVVVVMGWWFLSSCLCFVCFSFPTTFERKNMKLGEQRGGEGLEDLEEEICSEYS